MMWYPPPTHSLENEYDSESCSCGIVMDDKGWTSLDLCPWAEYFTRIGTWYSKHTLPRVTAHVRRALKFQAAQLKGGTADDIKSRKIREAARKESELRDEDD